MGGQFRAEKRGHIERIFHQCRRIEKVNLPSNKSRSNKDAHTIRCFRISTHNHQKFVTPV